MLYLDLQLTTARFVDLFNESIHALDLTGPWTEVIDPLEIFLDQVVPGASTFWVGDPSSHAVSWEDSASQIQVTDVDAPTVGVEQELALQSVLLIGRGTANPTLVPLPPGQSSLTMILEGGVDATGHPQVVLHPAYVTVNLPPMVGLDAWSLQYLGSIVADRIKALIPDRQLPIPSKRFNDLKVTIVDVGIATDPSHSRLAIRFQSLPRSPSIVGTWQAFHSGDFVDPFAGPVPAAGPFDWAAVVDSHVVEGMVRAFVDDGLKGRNDFHLVSGVGSTWQGAGPNGHVAVDFYGEVTVGAPLDPGVWVHTDMTIEAKAGQLESRSVSHATVDKGAAFFYSTLVNLVLPGLGTAIEAVVSATMSGTTAGGVADTLLVGFIQNTPIPYTRNPNLSGAWSCVKVDDETLICTSDGRLAFDLGDGRRLDMKLDEVVGLASAMVERGHVAPPPPVPDPTIDIVVDDPRWQAPEISCAEAGSIGPGLEDALKDPLSAFIATGDIVIEPGARPVTVFGTTLVSADPAQVVVGISGVAQETITISFRSNAQYEAAPYRFAFIVQTSAGVRLVWLGQIPPMTADEAKSLVVRMIGEAAECFKLVDPFYNESRRYNMKWSVDPEIGPRNYLERVWGIFVEHLPASDVKPIEKIE